MPAWSMPERSMPARPMIRGLTLGRLLRDVLRNPLRCLLLDARVDTVAPAPHRHDCSPCRQCCGAPGGRSAPVPSLGYSECW